VPDGVSPAVAGLGLGIALAGAPGPVQAILLTEVLRGGTGRGLRALAGANLTFGVLLIGLALGVSLAVPGEPALRILKIVGGAFIGWLAFDAFRSRDEPTGPVYGRPALSPALPPAARGALAVLLNPGAWLFLATAASSLVAAATQVGGRSAALTAALGLLAGVGMGDAALVLAGGLGLRRAGSNVGRVLRRALALVLALLGFGLILNGLLA
jgi:threonine/homoserine/homoserine lactone efflux protein